MTDKELLELCAKALKYDIQWKLEDNYGSDTMSYEPKYQLQKLWLESFTHYGYESWNPLESDKDRYDLCRLFELTVDFDDCTVFKRMYNGKLIQFFWNEISDYENEIVDTEGQAILKCIIEICKEQND